MAATIGETAAAKIYRALLTTTLARLHTIDVDGVLAYSPPAQEAAMKAVAPAGWRTIPQCEGGLGKRMESFFEEQFRRGYRRVVLLGADCPHLPLAEVDRAFALLADRPAVLGPTTDGGYYLLGAAETAPPIFANMPFSTSDLWSATAAALDAAGIAFHALQPCYDIDEFADLQRLWRELEATEPLDPPLSRLRDALAPVDL